MSGILEYIQLENNSQHVILQIIALESGSLYRLLFSDLYRLLMHYKLRHNGKLLYCFIFTI